jgi:hypothetical protein
VNTIVNYSISIGLGFAGTIESQINNGGKTPADQLRGFRGAFYMGIGLSGLGICISLWFLGWTLMKQRKDRGAEKSEGAAIESKDGI